MKALRRRFARTSIRLCVVAATGVAAVLAYGAAPTAGAAATPAWTPPPVGHVFVINLENKGFATTFGPSSAAPYLAKTLRAKGNLLTQYYGVAHNSLGNYIAQVSGQGPNPETQADCQAYTEFVGSPSPVPPGQFVGQGCIYPTAAKTIADQLTASHRSWRGYMQDMGVTPSREANRCGHPVAGAQDNTQQATKTDQYAARHNPFVYFHSLLDSGACSANDVPLRLLGQDLTQVSTTRSLSYITPNLCNDGHDAPCADGRPGGLVSANDWLKQWIPRILASPAYQKDGLIVITFDESDSPQSDSTACCGEGATPNTPQPGISGPGGGRVGGVLLSRWIRPGSTTNQPYNHYSLLASIEDLFHLPYLGYAGQSGLPRFGKDVFTAS